MGGSNGSISFDLEPNDTAVPSGTSYLVRFTPSRGGASGAWSERWVVPTSPTQLKINQIHVLNIPTPTIMLQPQQILGGGATPGKCLGWTGTSWQPVDCGAVGSVGATGPAGANGSNGNTVLSGMSGPTSAQGVNGDFFLRTDTSCIWGPKAAGAWPGTCTSLIGPQGIKGDTGIVGPAGSTGPQGIQGIQGSQGIQGLAGADGRTVLNGAVPPSAGTGARCTSNRKMIMKSVFDSNTR